VTTLLYLARPGEPEAYGTHLYRSDRPVAGAQERTYYPYSENEEGRCERVATIPFRANTALMFANVGLRGAEIPASAPADLERYSIQFYIGPADPNAAVASPMSDIAGAY
jgi:hypothetical protein